MQFLIDRSGEPNLSDSEEENAELRSESVSSVLDSIMHLKS